MAVRQGKLDSFVKKTGSSPRAQRVQSGPVRHAAAFKDARHSPMSKPGGSSVSCGDRDDGSHTRHSARQTEGTATSSIHSQGSTFSPLETGQQNPPAVSRKVYFSEVKGDLFSCPSSASLAHCVSEDMHMGKGIATLFKQKFGGVGELKLQGVKTGGLAVLRRGDRFVYYLVITTKDGKNLETRLVTKVRYFHKPTYDTLRSSLQAMRDHCVSNGVKELCMPRIGCGLDRLKWEKVVEIIQEVFAGLDISITVYYL